MPVPGRGWYFEHVVVDPEDADIVYVQNVSISRSTDGGRSWAALRGSPGGDDYHQSWISPDDPKTMIASSDQGCIITRNASAEDPRDVTWSSWYNQPTAQLYHVSVDPRFPYWVTGAQQDSGAVAVRSRGKFAEIPMRDWEPVAASGESGYTAGDPLHPGVIYGGRGSRYDMVQNRVIPGTTSPESPEPARGDWTQPLVLSPAAFPCEYGSAQPMIALLLVLMIALHDSVDHRARSTMPAVEWLEAYITVTSVPNRVSGRTRSSTRLLSFCQEGLHSFRTP